MNHHENELFEHQSDKEGMNHHHENELFEHQSDKEGMVGNRLCVPCTTYPSLLRLGRLLLYFQRTLMIPVL
jgi:hypothetical protein